MAIRDVSMMSSFPYIAGLPSAFLTECGVIHGARFLLRDAFTVKGMREKHTFFVRITFSILFTVVANWYLFFSVLPCYDRNCCPSVTQLPIFTFFIDIYLGWRCIVNNILIGFRISKSRIISKRCVE